MPAPRRSRTSSPALSGLITRHREPDTEVLRFPPVMNRRQVEKSGYLHSFPHLLGCVCGLHGDEAEIHAAVGRFNAGQEWTDALQCDRSRADAGRLLSALSARRRARRGAGARDCKFDVESYCFRREATFEVDRLQAFRMREYVCMGSPDDAVAFRARWLELAKELADDLALALPHRAGERSVLRPRGAHHRGKPGRAALEIRVAGAAALARSARPPA